MALSIFVDALPYTEMKAHYRDWFPNMQLAELQPNIAYSSSLHWQLYCGKYPDDRKILVDWAMTPEKSRSVRVLSTLLRPLDGAGVLGTVVKKGLDRVVYRRNAFANIPFRFRKDFSEVGQYLFWDPAVYGKESIFAGYAVVSQDEGHISFAETLERFHGALIRGERNIMLVTGFPDAIGHKVKRGDVYSDRLAPDMEKLRSAIQSYREAWPEEEVLLVSDHGMSTIERKIDLGLPDKFGKPGRDTYIAYSDSCILCVWAKDTALLEKIRTYLSSREEGHLLTEAEREYYRATDRGFGDLLYILREGNVFADSWFGKSLRKPSDDGAGMHGFWPERTAKDQMASIVLLSQTRRLEEFYTYPSAHRLIQNIM